MISVKRSALLITILIFCINYGYSQANLILSSVSSDAKISIDTEVSLNLTITNTGNAGAGGILILVSSPYTMPIAIYKGSTGNGSFDASNGIWNIGTLNPGDTARHTIRYILSGGGIWYTEAEVFKTNSTNLMALPNNHNDTESDFTRSCISVPIEVESDSFPGMQFIVNDNQLSITSWSLNGSPLVQNNNTNLIFNQTGTYTYTTSGFICPEQGCCPLYVELQSQPTSCCQPLEFFMSRASLMSSVQNINTPVNDNEDTTQVNAPVNEPIIVDSTTLDVSPGDTIYYAKTSDIDLGQDAFISSAFPSLNFGDNHHLFIKSENTFPTNTYYRSLLKFDLSDIPAGVQILDANIRFFYSALQNQPSNVGLDGEEIPQNEFYLRRITSNWEETTLNWENQPNYTREQEILVNPVVSEIDNILDVDISELLQTIINNPAENFGFILMLKTEQGDRSVTYASSDADGVSGTQSPVISIEFIYKD